MATRDEALSKLYELVETCATRATKSLKANNLTTANYLMDTAQRAANVAATLIDDEPTEDVDGPMTAEMEPTP